MIALSAFIACAKTIKSAYNINGRCAKWRYKMESTTIIIAGKRFTETGENSLYIALTNATQWMLKTYSVFYEYKTELENNKK